MIIDITVLGTSGSTPTKSRRMPGVAITYDGAVYLFDCGEGTQMQMIKYRINASRLKGIFITHMHGDHIIGVVGLVRTLALNNREAPLQIYVPKGYEKMMREFITFDNVSIYYKIEIIGVKSGVVYKDDKITISAFRLNHAIPTFGYVFAENERRRFIKEKCAALGIRGAMFGELQRKGSIIVNGKKVYLESVTTAIPGKKIVYASDTRPSSSTVKAARNADLLIHEATYSEADSKKAIERKHSTATEAAQVAKRAAVKALLLVHVSARYRRPNQLQKEAEAIFPNTKVARDGTHIKL